MQINSFLKKPKVAGYTLAETLIALAVIGVAAMFLIPKIVQSVTDQQYQAKMKQTIGILDKIQTQGATTGDLTPNNFTTYLFQNLNTLKQCPNGGITDGCISNSDNYIEMNEPAVILQNGVTITGLNNCCTNYGLPYPNGDLKGMYFNGMVIDVNGLQGPNAIGQDQVMVVYCYGPTNCLGDRGSSSTSCTTPGSNNCNVDNKLGTPNNNTASNPFASGSFAPSDSSLVSSQSMANTCQANIALFNKLMNQNWVSSNPTCR